MAQTILVACVACFYKCDKFDNFPIPISVVVGIIIVFFCGNILCRLCLSREHVHKEVTEMHFYCCYLHKTHAQLCTQAKQ